MSYHQRDLPPTDSPAKSVLTFLLGLLSFIFISTFLLLAVMRPGNVETFIGNTDIAWVLEETGVQAQIDAALENFPAYDSVHAPVQAQEIQEFLHRENVTGELANVVGGFVYAFIEGNLDYHITPDEIVAMARNLEPDIQDHFGYTMTEDDFRILSTTLDQVDLDALSVARVIEETDINLDVVGTVFSVYPLIIFGTLSVMGLLTIFAVNGRNIPKALRAVGVTILLPGLLFFPIGLFFLVLPGMFSGVLYVGIRFLGGPATLMMQYGIISCIIGIALMISSGVVRSAQRRDFVR